MGKESVGSVRRLEGAEQSIGKVFVVKTTTTATTTTTFAVMPRNGGRISRVSTEVIRCLAPIGTACDAVQTTTTKSTATTAGLWLPLKANVVELSAEEVPRLRRVDVNFPRFFLLQVVLLRVNPHRVAYRTLSENVTTSGAPANETATRK